MGDSIKVANEDDSAVDDGDSPSEGFLWQYTDLLKYGKEKFEIISKINTSDKYIKITGDVKEEKRANHGYEITLSSFEKLFAAISKYQLFWQELGTYG